MNRITHHITHIFIFMLCALSCPLVYARKEPTILAFAHVAVADALRAHRTLKIAVEHLETALSLYPNNSTIMFDLANTYNNLERSKEALRIYYKLLLRAPNNAMILYNTAYTLKKLARVPDALLFYDAALEQKPEYPEALFSRSLAYLITGDFKRGWPAYESRVHYVNGLRPRNCKQPIWTGQDLTNKILYLYAEQGLGDTLQFVRFAEVAHNMGATIILSAQNPLVSLLSNCPYIARVIPFDHVPTTLDYHLPLMSLPATLKTTMENLPKKVPYIFPKKELVQEWKEKLAHDTNFKIGVCWQGNNRYNTVLLKSVVAAKAVTVNMFAPISKIPGVSIYSLQKMTGVDQLSHVDNDFTLHTFDGDFDDSHGRFMDTAAVMKNLDMVLTVDTSIAHLAGGMNVPVWILLPEPGDWRWMLFRNDSPWYPSMKLFRQPTPGDWNAVIDMVAQELPHHIANKKNKTTEQSPVSQPQSDDVVDAKAQRTQELQETIAHIEATLACAKRKLDEATTEIA